MFVFFEYDWGINIKDWLLTQASAVALAAVAIIIIPMIFKKMWAGLIGTLFTSAIALLFVNKPQMLTGIGQIIYNIIFE
ncbi:MAG: hypothetical protein ABF289_10085 [Clostridiales bacterium]